MLKCSESCTFSFIFVEIFKIVDINIAILKNQLKVIKSTLPSKCTYLDLEKGPKSMGGEFFIRACFKGGKQRSYNLPEDLSRMSAAYYDRIWQLVKDECGA